jgi:bacillolysin
MKTNASQHTKKYLKNRNNPDIKSSLLIGIISGLLLLFGLTFSLNTYAQKKYVKDIDKKTTGSKPASFQYQTIPSSKGQKSASLSPHKANNQFKKPDLTGINRIENRVMIKGETALIERKSDVSKKLLLSNPEERFSNFMKKAKIGGLNPLQDFKISHIDTDELGITHIKSTQLYKGVEIYGSESTTHFRKGEERFTGRLMHINEEIDVVPALRSDEALKIIDSDLEKQTVVRPLSTKEKEILKYESSRTKLALMKNEENSFSLVWEVETRPNFIEIWKYFVDARTGEILKKFNATNTNGPATATAYDLNNVLQNINTYLENGTYFMVNASESMFDANKFEGLIYTYDANNTSTRNFNFKSVTSRNNQWSNKAAVSAAAYTSQVYKYLSNTFGRRSLNDNGGDIVIFVNVAGDDGKSMDNAFWNGEAAFFGNGVEYKPLVGANDIVAHEFGHGVISNTANLEYYAQSGAINEMYADIFGAMVDRDDWKIGEDASKTSRPMRDMQNPANGGTTVFDGWLPKHMSEYVSGPILDNFVNRDQEGVHINCGIGNYAYYLYATAVSKEKAEQVFYRALTRYLTKTSQYIDLRIAIVQSARDLYGDQSNEAKQAADAFDKVGIYEEETISREQDYQANTGQQYLLSYNTSPSYSFTLYRSTPSGDNLTSLSSTEMKSKVSTTDDGSVAVFVSTDDKIKRIILDPQDTDEKYLSDEAIWDNVAVSKDGNRIAAISTDIDTAIYVYDYESARWAKFPLYNPTTSHDNSFAGGVLFADAIEFDITGEYLIYDAYNQYQSTTSEDFQYWDIGFIKVWDKTRNKFGDGSISKLFSSLPKDVSVGNPVFSNNSPHIIAFDYYDEFSDEYAIIGVNLETGDLDVIYENTTWGLPSFSTLDDNIAFSGHSFWGDEAIGVIALDASKIVSKGDPYLVVDYAKWPVYYATGNRALGLAPVANFTANYKQGRAPFTVQFFDISANNPTQWNWLFPGGIPSSSVEQNPIVVYYDNGEYQVSLTAKNSYGQNVSTKTSYIKVGDYNRVDEITDIQTKVYPNPADGYLFINSPVEFSYRIVDLAGKEYLRNKSKNLIDITVLPKGFFVLEIKTPKETLHRKFQKM